MISGSLGSLLQQQSSKKFPSNSVLIIKGRRFFSPNGFLWKALVVLEVPLCFLSHTLSVSQRFRFFVPKTFTFDCQSIRNHMHFYSKSFQRMIVSMDFKSVSSANFGYLLGVAAHGLYMKSQLVRETLYRAVTQSCAGFTSHQNCSSLNLLTVEFVVFLILLFYDWFSRKSYYSACSLIIVVVVERYCIRKRPLTWIVYINTIHVHPMVFLVARLSIITLKSSTRHLTFRS